MFCENKTSLAICQLIVSLGHGKGEKSELQCVYGAHHDMINCLYLFVGRTDLSLRSRIIRSLSIPTQSPPSSISQFIRLMGQPLKEQKEWLEEQIPEWRKSRGKKSLVFLALTTTAFMAAFPDVQDARPKLQQVSPPFHSSSKKSH